MCQGEHSATAGLNACTPPPHTHLFAPLGSAKGHCWGKIAAGQRWGCGCGVPPHTLSTPGVEGEEGGVVLTLCPHPAVKE